MSKGLVLDLDDTLYLERDYVRSGFKHVARHLAAVVGLPEEVVFDYLWSGFKAGERGNAFDTLVEEFPEVGEHESVSSLVGKYREHTPSISMHEPLAVEALAESSIRLALISDGYPVSQQAKLDALDLAGLFDAVILTDEWGATYRKPHHRAFEAVEEIFSLHGPDLLYVADNPQKDFIAPNQRGWLSIRIRIPGQLHELAEPADAAAAPTHEVVSLQEVSSVWPFLES